MKKVLSIAGHDPSNGAGITRDLEVFAAFGLHGLSVPTSLVIQGPDGVHDVYPVPVEPFMTMLDGLGSLGIDGVKVGVLVDAVHVEQVTEFVAGLGAAPVVLDPVIEAKNGVRLITDDGLRRMVEDMFPFTDVVTPNLEEAERILGATVRSEEDMKQAAAVIATMGPKHVLIKGGHLAGDPADLLFDGQEFHVFKRARMEAQVHGTGCTFSSLLLSFLALGYPVKEAFFETEQAMSSLLAGAYRISDTGYFYASIAHSRSEAAERYGVLGALEEAGGLLEKLCMEDLIPEVQMNVGYALRRPRGGEDVAAFPGRIGKAGGKVLIKGRPAFGASSYVAGLVLACMERFPHMRACANLRFDERFIRAAEQGGMSVVRLDRGVEKDGISANGGEGQEYIAWRLLREAENPPDVVYDTGDIGREPMIRLFARNPLELIEKMERIRS